MSRRVFIAALLAIVAVALALRIAWLTSDPPTTATVGVVWHDEGAWVHNARNRALWKVWRTDNWNPMFLAPVFTGLEFAAFQALGVGTWQARTVPVASGCVAVAFLMAGLAALSGRRVALLGGALLATNYVFVMWNRAALMESTMTAWLVVSWGAYALAKQRPQWGLVSGVAAILAFFTKASAAFFLSALAIEAATAAFLRLQGSTDPISSRPGGAPDGHLTDASRWMLIGFASAAALIGVLFVLPHWSEYRFYNWQMSVERKPAYSLGALMMRASWLPLVHDFFTWMWPVFVLACVGVLRIAGQWRDARPAERLLVLWVIVGLLELVVHDSGNERRYVMFIPALIGLAANLLSARRVQSRSRSSIGTASQWVGSGLALGLGYLVAASALRLYFLEQVRSGHLHTTVVLSVIAAGVIALIVWLRWAMVAAWLRSGRVPTFVATAAIATTLATDAVHFAGWARDRQTRNIQASRDLGRLLAAGTLVQGKLANGLALENRIRPIFIGHGFGNYADRLQRDDVRYILTYISPSVGFESQAGSDMIQEILDRYPHRRVLATFTVDETGGPDRAALIEKTPGTDSRAPDK